MMIRPGQNLLHYRLIEKIGEGGMGVVWKALDTTLDRDVATDISADGSCILFMRQDEMVYEVWLRRTDGSAPTRLGSGMSLSLSPDGKWAMAGLFSRNSPLTLLPTGAGIPQKLDGKSGALFADWTPDGRGIAERSTFHRPACCRRRSFNSTFEPASAICYMS